MPNINNVTYGKPKVGGAIFSAPVGTALPKNATETLNPAFKDLGYISEDGLTNKNTPETETVKAWGGDTVLTIYEGKEDSFSYKLIEVMNLEVLKEVYGQDNVTGTLEGGITIKANSKPLVPRSYVVDMIYKGNVLKRVVIPNAEIAEIGEISYADDDAVGFEVTLNASADAEGNTHYEYIQKAKD